MNSTVGCTERTVSLVFTVCSPVVSRRDLEFSPGVHSCAAAVCTSEISQCAPNPQPGLSWAVRYGQVPIFMFFLRNFLQFEKRNQTTGLCC